VRIAVAGKGGVGKTTVSGTIARLLARDGRRVLALDADTNPMRGIALGLEVERSEGVATVRRASADGAVHEHTADGLADAFGVDAPDGVRLLVVARHGRADPG
jgi:CO dehydrogenase maturation factor